MKKEKTNKSDNKKVSTHNGPLKINTPVNSIFFLQRSIGNHATAELLNPKTIQIQKLPGDSQNIFSSQSTSVQQTILTREQVRDTICDSFRSYTEWRQIKQNDISAVNEHANELADICQNFRRTHFSLDSATERGERQAIIDLVKGVYSDYWWRSSQFTICKNSRVSELHNKLTLIYNIH